MKDTKDKEQKKVRFGKYDLNFVLNVISAQILNQEMKEDGIDDATHTKPLHDRQDIHRRSKK